MVMFLCSKNKGGKQEEEKIRNYLSKCGLQEINANRFNNLRLQYILYLIELHVLVDTISI